MILKNLQLFGSTNASTVWQWAIQLIASGQVPVGELITNIVPYEALPEALDIAASRPEGVMKVVVEHAKD